MPNYLMEFTQDELQIIGNAVAELPYKMAAPFLAKLQMKIQTIDFQRQAAASEAKAAEADRSEP